MSASRPATDATRLQIDRIACTGHGICASLLPDAMRLDEWGYPLLTGDGTAGTAEARRAAVRLCPAMAVYLSAGT